MGMLDRLTGRAQQRRGFRRQPQRRVQVRGCGCCLPIPLALAIAGGVGVQRLVKRG